MQNETEHNYLQMKTLNNIIYWDRLFTIEFRRVVLYIFYLQ